MMNYFVSALALAGAASALPVRRTETPSPTNTTGSGNSTVKFMGVNIAGFDFGTDIWGNAKASSATPPLLSMGGVDGIGQMEHFARDKGHNMFRLPVSWQYLLDGSLTNTLDNENAYRYDELVRGCLNITGAHCLLDIHNYARWNGAVVNQVAVAEGASTEGIPTEYDFTNLWTMLAQKYGNESKIVFGLMNEPHHLPDLAAWVRTAQAGVTAIRQYAPHNMILLPGTDFTSAGAMAHNSGPHLMSIVNPDNSTDNLVFDVHKYLDVDYSGTHDECVSDNIEDALVPLAAWLRANKRTALMTETGGGNTASCIQYVCNQFAFMDANADVFQGYLGWSAGAFDPATYELSEVPQKNDDGSWTDTALVNACLTRPTNQTLFYKSTQ